MSFNELQLCLRVVKYSKEEFTQKMNDYLKKVTGEKAIRAAKSTVVWIKAIKEYFEKFRD